MPKKTGKSKTQYVRDYLKEVGEETFMNLSNVDIAKAISQEHPESALDNHTVANFKSELRRKDQPKPTGKRKKKGSPKKKKRTAKGSTTPAAVSTELVPYTHPSRKLILELAMEYVDSVGGVDKAISVLQALRSVDEIVEEK